MLSLFLGIGSAMIYTKYFVKQPEPIEKPIIETKVKVKTIYVPEKTVNKVDIDLKENSSANEKLEKILKAIEGEI